MLSILIDNQSISFSYLYSMPMNAKQYLTADETIAELGISKATLYSYVSRGLIHSEEVGGKTRVKRYVAEDVARLKQRKEQRRNPAQAAATPPR